MDYSNIWRVGTIDLDDTFIFSLSSLRMLFFLGQVTNFLFAMLLQL